MYGKVCAVDCHLLLIGSPNLEFSFAKKSKKNANQSVVNKLIFLLAHTKCNMWTHPNVRCTLLAMSIRYTQPTVKH